MPKKQMLQACQISNPAIGICSGKCCIGRSKHCHWVNLLYQFIFWIRLVFDHFCDNFWVKMTFVNLEAKAVSWRARERSESLGKEWMRPNTDLQLGEITNYRRLDAGIDRRKRKREIREWDIHAVGEGEKGEIHEWEANCMMLGCWEPTNLWSSNVSVG